MSMWRSQARGLTSRMALGSTSAEPDTPRTRYRLRAFEDGDGYAWEVWDGKTCVEQGHSRTLEVAQAYADAVAAGHPGVIGRRRAPARRQPPPERRPAQTGLALEMLFVAGSLLGAVYWTWAFVARGGGAVPMLVSLAVLAVVGAYSSRGSLWGVPGR